MRKQLFYVLVVGFLLAGPGYALSRERSASKNARAATTCTTPVRMKTPLVTKLYSADPAAHVFSGKIWVYTSHDLTKNPPPSNDGDQYRMKDYHVFSLNNMVCSPVVDHGAILSIKNVPWATKQMWAPDAAFKNKTYYLYFPAKGKDGIFRIGAATSASPAGPFKARPSPIPGSYSIDPAVFVDTDGTAYMYFGGIWGGQLQDWQTGSFVNDSPLPVGSEPAIGPRVVKLTPDMLHFAGPITEVQITDAQGKPLTAADNYRRFFEGIWVFKYKGTYYMSYSTGDTHYVVYATSKSPTGPFTYRGRLLKPVKGWTTQGSIIQFKGEWYLFYHDDSLSGIDNERSIKVARLTLNPDGRIKTITP